MKNFAIFLLLFAASCSYLVKSPAPMQNLSDYPSWYLSPEPNNSQEIYGIGEGFTLEEATKDALADAASRLSVSISATSTLLLQENNFDASEETRRKIEQNIEKIDFPGFEVSQSASLADKIYVQVSIDRQNFIKNQQRKIDFEQRRIENLTSDLNQQNLIRQRVKWQKILESAKQLEVISRIIDDEPVITSALRIINRAENSLDKISDKIEFYISSTNSKRIKNIIKNAINQEKMQVATKKSDDKNQIQLAIYSSHKSSVIYESYITKIRIQFDNYTGGKITSSNIIEVSGSSTVDQKESYDAALKSLEDKVKEDGVLEIIGVL